MTAVLAIVLLFAPTGVSLDLPPEGIYAPATASAPAERLDPPTTPPLVVESTTPTFANDCAEMSWYRQRAGLPARFDQLGWRESNCRNEDGVHTGCCVGWWQLNVSLHLRDHRLIGAYHACGVWSAGDVNSDTPEDKQRQACAAAALFGVVGYSAWSTS